MLEFRDFAADDRKLVQSYTLNLPYKNCDLAFANMFVWKFLYNTKICTTDDFLYVTYQFHGKPFFMLPLGKGDLKKAIENIVEFNKSTDQRFCIQGLSLKMKDRVEALMPNVFSFTTNRDYSDYLYLREDLIRLSGKKLQPKRNHINQFKRNYPNYKFLPITPELIPICLEFETLWAAQQSVHKDASSLENERCAIKNAFANYERLGLHGGVLMVEDKVVAFSYGSPINEITFDVAVEKASPDFIGSYATINQEFSRSIPEQYVYVNREEDLGIEGLRKAKLSYMPAEILDKYTAHFYC